MIDDEFEGFRPAPPSPYRRTGRILEAPRTLLDATVKALQSVKARESACLWLGTSSDHGDRVCALVVPKQTNRPFNYSIEAKAMEEVATCARPHGWTLLASVHSHPGINVEHSNYDDLMMPGRRAFSIVFPRYGRWSGPWPTGVGVHEFVDNYWHLLAEDDVQDRMTWLEHAQAEERDLR